MNLQGAANAALRLSVTAKLTVSCAQIVQRGGGLDMVRAERGPGQFGGALKRPHGIRRAAAVMQRRSQLARGDGDTPAVWLLRLPFQFLDLVQRFLSRGIFLAVQLQIGPGVERAKVQLAMGGGFRQRGVQGFLRFRELAQTALRLGQGQQEFEPPAVHAAASSQGQFQMTFCLRPITGFPVPLRFGLIEAPLPAPRLNLWCDPGRETDAEAEQSGDTHGYRFHRRGGGSTLERWPSMSRSCGRSTWADAW